MHALLLIKRYENDPDNVYVLHKAYDLEDPSTNDPYVGEYIDLEDEAWGVLDKMIAKGIQAEIITLVVN